MMMMMMIDENNNMVTHIHLIYFKLFLIKTAPELLFNLYIKNELNAVQTTTTQTNHNKNYTK